MKKNLITIGLFVTSMLCSGFSYKGENSHITFTVNEDYAESTEEVGTFCIDGKYIKLPFKVSLLTDIGYSVESEWDKVLPAQSESYGVNLYDSSGRRLSLYVRNDSDEDLPAEECWCWSVGYEPREDDSIGHLDFSISGVTPGAGEKMVMEKLGLPKSNTTVSGDNYVMWYTTKDDYSIAIDYNGVGIFDMRLTVDKPADKLDNALMKDYPESKTSTAVANDSTIGKYILLGILAVVGIPVLAATVIILVSVHHNHKRRMAEIDRDILNIDIQKIPDELEEIYKK